MNQDQKDGIDAHAFFGESTYLDHLALKPLSHIHPYWELTWNSKNNKYTPEENSFAQKLNKVLAQLDRMSPPEDYHKFEDILVEYVKKKKDDTLFKYDGKWMRKVEDEIKNAEYDYILEQGGFHDPYEYNLLKAVKGRMKAAIERGQKHFDEMEHYHQLMLATLLSIILYQRAFI